MKLIGLYVFLTNYQKINSVFSVGISHSLNKTRVLRGSCSNALAKVTLSADQQKSLLDAHASARGRVAPSAAGMKTLVSESICFTFFFNPFLSLAFENHYCLNSRD